MVSDPLHNHTGSTDQPGLLIYSQPQLLLCHSLPAGWWIHRTAASRLSHAPAHSTGCGSCLGRCFGGNHFSAMLIQPLPSPEARCSSCCLCVSHELRREFRTWIFFTYTWSIRIINLKINGENES